MIKCKEDLLNTYVDNNEEELLKEYLKLCKLHEVSWRSGAIACEFLPELRFTTIEGGVLVQTEWAPKGKRLTLEDFAESSSPNLEGHVTMDELQEILHGEESNEPDSVIFAPENKQSVSKYKYTPIEVESVFELKEPLEKGKLFYGNAHTKIPHEWKLINLLVEDKHKIYLREEVRWQEQISEGFNFTYVEKEDSFVQMGRTSSEDMVLFAKRVLELSGELK
tara:strand:+ start:1054 stop:1719 length:666 start_codon:yes stop_codon:yes gene_type:complete